MNIIICKMVMASAAIKEATVSLEVLKTASKTTVAAPVSKMKIDGSITKNTKCSTI